MVYPFLTGIAGKEVTKKIATNPNVVGPLLISAVGAQNAEKIINAYDSNKILLMIIGSIKYQNTNTINAGNANQIAT